MIKNILPAILVAAIRNFDIKSMRRALQAFVPGPTFTPGRMNIFRFSDFEVMVDYAHNAHGFEELASFMSAVRSPEKIGIIAAPGDRRDEDITAIGEHAARIFDKIIIRHDKDGRGRTNDTITGLFMKGINKVNDRADVRIVSDEIEAVQYAMDHAGKGAFIVCCSDNVQDTLDFLEDELQHEQQMKNDPTVTH